MAPAARRPLPRIDEVAQAAGVSKTTVSHVLSGRRPVSDATRARVLAVVKEMGFRPNGVARSLKSNKSLTVAILVEDVTNPFYPALARGVQLALHSHGYMNFVVDVGQSPHRSDQLLLDAVDRRVDGLILASLAIDPKAVESVIGAGVPVVAAGPAVPGMSVDMVFADDRQIGRDAGRYLVQLGHSKIGSISGPQSSVNGRERQAGFLEALEEAGVKPAKTRQAQGDWTRAGGRESMTRLINARAVPTAVFCANDLMAIGALDSLRAAGLGAPSDVAVVGVDDIDAASLVTPALTTVRIPAGEIGARAGRLLLARMESREQNRLPVVEHVAHELIIRESA